MSATYKQEVKNHVRHSMIRDAVELLTTNRSSACCVKRTYVRNLYDYFIRQEESHEQTEVKKIDLTYIREWENMHTNDIGSKRACELSVCYLAGPEPENDFNEFVALGVLPQNIWAVESERGTYLEALHSIDSSDFMQPKLVKTSIERFFENTPKKFDIVYIDSCAPLISDQHALRCISSMFRYHRLESPGILLSNFANIDSSHPDDCKEYYDLISRYFYIKENQDATLINDNGIIKISGDFQQKYDEVASHFEQYYGDFITAMICDAGSITIPTLRFVNSTYLQNLTTTNPLSNYQYSFSDVNTINNNTIYKYLAFNRLLEQKNFKTKGSARINKLSNELSACWNGFDLLACSKKLFDIRQNEIDLSPTLINAIDFFSRTENMYQFLDRPNKVLFFDSVINQFAYPMHYCSDNLKRLTYIAKQTRMFMDLIVFDECRYIYDWIPAIHQIPNAFSNVSWQYIFRFALDGLVKQRLNYNNEFFFQGSVVNKNTPGFEAQSMQKRMVIN
jgi:hypothetical protein